jgi:tRNA-Thr(GGU) m(6)t(6)A37 methyltransferase TsaA
MSVPVIGVSKHKRNQAETVRNSEATSRTGTGVGTEPMKESQFLLWRIGTVRSPLKSREDCPKQGFEGAPDAWLEIDPAFVGALDGLEVGRDVLVLTWMHEADRSLLQVHPRGDLARPMRGVFATRSPDRPNPIGLHRVEIVEMQLPARIRVRPLEAVDGTPVIDIKPVMLESEEY